MGVCNDPSSTKYRVVDRESVSVCSRDYFEDNVSPYLPNFDYIFRLFLKVFAISPRKWFLVKYAKLRKRKENFGKN